jgi:hypothetical protein
MKPLNLDNSPCSPISSNCVIWAGPDLQCIKLCKGDTVSDVVFKLATELCQILDTLDIANYDLSCFNLTSCAPSDFEALINFLIQRICALENIPTPENNTGGTGCPTDCLVNVPECLNTDTSVLNLIDYVNLLASKICVITTEITVLQASVSDLDARVTVLEDALPPTFTIPTVDTTCNIGTLVPDTYEVQVITEEFLNVVWCSFYSTTGTASALSTAVSAQCVFIADLALSVFYSNPGQTMGAEYPTYTAPTTVASAINNLWLALCDVRNAEIMEYEVTASDDITVSTSVVGAMTTFDIGRTPKINYYAEATTALQLSSDPGYVDLTYFVPAAYAGLTYTNTSGVTKDYFVRVSYDTNLQNIASNSSDLSNQVDGALFKNGVTSLYQSAGSFFLSAHLFDGPLSGDVIDIGTAEQVLTAPSSNPVEFRFLNTNFPRNVSFFKKVTLNNGESVDLRFRSKGLNAGYLLQAQFYVEEIR